MDVKKVEKTEQIPSGYEIVINGGRTPMGIDALQWAIEGERLGAGELVVNSIDADGTKEGYEINLTRMIADAVTIPVIASGGVASLADVQQTHDAGLSGVIIGRALYEGQVKLEEALRVG